LNPASELDRKVDATVSEMQCFQFGHETEIKFVTFGRMEKKIADFETHFKLR